MIHSFNPIIDKNCRILLLGTMQQNDFWKIIFSLFDQEVTPEYAARKAFLNRKGDEK